MPSSAVDVHQRSGIWSYFNFNSSPATTRNRRTSSVSLPTRNQAYPFERSDRRSDTASSAFSHDGKTAWMNHGQRARYLKAGGLIAFVLLFFFYFAPGDRVGQYVGDHAPSLHSGDHGHSHEHTPVDPSADTTKCSKPYRPHKPLVQYALMIDAGSTGSRIHVYKFNNCGPTPELEEEIFEQTAKREGGSGLSSYKEDAEGAARSLDPLMDVAVKNVPNKFKSCTPVAVKATAGLRKLGKEASERILEAVRHRLETAYPFPVVAEDKGGVEVMDGKDEGVYAWITANYLLGKIGGPDHTPTAAVFDLGGGSTQIVFEPTFPMPGGGMPETLAEGDHRYELDFGGRKFTLYQHSYLGYGLMAARENLHRAVVEAMYESHKDDNSWLERPVMNPCIAPGMSREVTVEMSKGHALGDKVKVQMMGPKEGAPVQCRALAERTLKKDAECTLHPCAFNGVHQPSLDKTFAREDVYLFSYFYDRTQPLGMPESFTLRELKDLADRVCHGEGHWDVFQSVNGAMKELHGRPEWCLDLNFMLALLHTGYEMPIEREVKIAKKIKGNELGWCLGASLPLLSQESGWKCKIKEITK
ncbi:hypothetical protein EJ06DRAFT_550058 [Trichodelitschia bisporula]|uniref:guanosine-diphosphatase n=1 Tax=Trichodelitschia bisporula TaxID=703511 RepID=A0A6G1HRY6_9PEZI|nr:hypothetical protein EJ06DRAFT_550058 [Trichodelitschia bisporula]